MSELRLTDELNLATLADEINAEHRACDAALRAGLNHAVRAGELLAGAKSRVKHGEWGRWLEENFEGSARTAQAYMKVAREIPNLDEAKAQRVADLSYRSALAELSAPVSEETTVFMESEPPEEPEEPISVLVCALGEVAEDWDFERDVPLTKTDLKYLAKVVCDEPEVGRTAAELFFGEDPGGHPRLNPHGVRDPRTAVAIGRIRQECGFYTYQQLFEQVETADVPLVRHDRAQLEYMVSLARKGEPDTCMADVVAQVGARWKLRNSVAQLQYLVDLSDSGVTDEEAAEMVRWALREKKTLYKAAREVLGLEDQS